MNIPSLNGALFAARLRPSRLRAHLPEFSALVLLAAFCTLAWLIWEYRRTVDLVVHSVEVETSILEVFSAVHDAESGSSGFVLTGDDVYLQHYNRAEQSMQAKTVQLQSLTLDNPDQQGALAGLKSATEASLAALKQGIDLRRTAGIDAAIAFIRVGDGAKALEKVRTEITRMAAVERNLYSSRVGNVQWVTIAGMLTAVLAFCVVVGSMAAWIWNTRREARELLTTIADRERSEAQIRQMQKIEAVGQLSGGLAHDLNNMLAVIISGLNLVEKRLAAGDTNVQRFTSAAMDGATRAATLTNRLMAFSRQLPLAPEPVDANRLVGGMSDLMQRTLGETIQIKTVLTVGLWSTHADAGQLENAILNLSINARDAMADGGKLTIETANCQLDAASARQYDMPAGHYVEIAVSDTGTGMTADVMTKAFDPFFTTKGVGKGTGLGLSQVYGFIKQSGGHIKIYSEPDQGTTIKMFLPRLRAPDQEPKPAAAPRETVWTDLHQDNSSHIILVVEDDERVREMSVSSLRELGYTVIHANGAVNALVQLDAHPETAMLFTDIVMPEINGRQLAAEVSRRQPHIKVLYTTGFTRDAIIHSGKLDAGLHFIAKPFTLAQVAAKMRDVLAQGTAA